MSVVLGLSVITMIGGVGFRGCGQSQNQAEDQPVSPTIASVGDFHVTKQMTEASDPGPLEGKDRLRTEGQMLNSAIQRGLALTMAKKQGVDLSDAIVKQAVVKAELDTMRQTLEQQGKLRPGASEQEFEDAFKSMAGRSLIDARKQLEKSISEKLGGTASDKAEAQASIAGQLLAQKIKSRYMPSESEIQNQFDTYTMKALTLPPDKAGPTAILAKMKKVQAEIKAGATFESEMDKYLPKPADKKKKASENSFPVRADMLNMYPFLAGIKKLKAGEVSDIVTTPGGPMMYKLVNHKLDLPKDYAAQKATLMDQKALENASKAIQEDVKKLDTADNVKWNSEGFHVLHDYIALDSGPPDANKNKQLRSLIDRALKVGNDPVGGEAAAATARLSLDQAVIGLPAAEADKLKTDVLAYYAQTFPEIPAKLDLAEAYIGAKDAANASTALVNAADSNSIRTDDEGKTNWERIQKDIKKAQDAKLLTPEQLQNLDKLYSDWLKNYSDIKSAEAKQKLEEQKRDEELKKQGTAPSAPSGTAPTLKTTPEAPPANKDAGAKDGDKGAPPKGSAPKGESPGKTTGKP